VTSLAAMCYREILGVTATAASRFRSRIIGNHQSSFPPIVATRY
jgi:hypothetical protein